MSNPVPRACAEAVRNNDFGPDYATKIATAVLSAFVAGEVEGPYDVVAPFEDGPLTRVRHKTLFGHEWSFAYQHMARAVANVLNYLEAQRA